MKGKITIKKKVWFMFSGIIILVGVVFSVVSYFSYSGLIIFNGRNVAELTQKEFNDIVQKDEEKMKLALDLLKKDSQMKEIYLRNNREELYAYTEPIFSKLKNDFNITHFYFHSADGTNFLRVHDKNTFGDKIERETFVQAVESKNLGEGLELGKTAFALRVVEPYYDQQGNLIGYLELGEEIDHFLESLKKMTGNEMAFFVKKENIKQADWSLIQKNSEKRDNWNDLSDYLLIDATAGEKELKYLEKCFSQTNVNNVFQKNSNSFIEKYSLGGKQVGCGGITFNDADNDEAGIILFAADFSYLSSASLQGVFLSFGMFIFIMLITFILYNYFIKKFILQPIYGLQEATKKISQGSLDARAPIISEDEMGELADNFNGMAKRIENSQGEIRKKVAEQTKEIMDKQIALTVQQRAILNVLDDVEWEKKKVSAERDKIDAILHSIGDGVFVVDANKKITMINKVTKKISGFSKEELIGEVYNQKLKFVFEKDNQENKEFIDRAIKTGEIQEMANHTMLIRKDGSQVAVADSAAPLKNKEGKVIGCVVVFRDVTKEREIDRMKTEFVSLASHQLRTPLTSIKWYAELLLTDEKKSKITGEKKEFVQEIHNGNERMINLVNDLLNVSRIETGKKFVIEKEKTDIVPIVMQAIKEQEVLAAQKKIQIVCENKPQGEMVIEADGEKIKQVFQNFISNAVKYSPEGGVVKIGCSEDENSHIFSVKDQGLGIPKDQQDRIFEKFFRASNVLLTEAEGTGLGLYIAKSIVEGHGGKIWFESEEKKGTTFYISLPKKV